MSTLPKSPPPLHPSHLDLVHACRILVYLKLDSGPFGNVSLRVPSREAYAQNPLGLTFDRLSTEDILTVDREGRVLEGAHPAHPGEFIHREIYRLRPDVGAVVHTHSANTVAFTLLGIPLEPFTQIGASFFGDQGVYGGFSGPVRDSQEGLAIATALGPHSLVIAKNHGIFAVGPDLPSALWNFVMADAACKVQLDARALGLSRAERLDATSIQKSRREVRDRQAHLMWKNYIDVIHRAARTPSE